MSDESKQRISWPEAVVAIAVCTALVTLAWICAGFWGV